MDATGYSRTTISVLISQYNKHGPEAVRDKRQDNRADTALTLDQQTQLSQALLNTPPMGGVWTSGKVQAYVQEEFGIEITPPCAWGYLTSCSLGDRGRKCVLESENLINFQLKRSETHFRGEREPNGSRQRPPIRPCPRWSGRHILIRQVAEQIRQP